MQQPLRCEDPARDPLSGSSAPSGDDGSAEQSLEETPRFAEVSRRPGTGLDKSRSSRVPLAAILKLPLKEKHEAWARDPGQQSGGGASLKWPFTFSQKISDGLKDYRSGANHTYSVQDARQNQGIYYGWIIVATAAVGLLLGAFPISVASFGMFFPAYMADFHARRSAIALAFTAHNIVAAFSTFVVGRLADRFGARTVILTGSAALGAVLLSAHAIGSHTWQLYLLYGLLAAAGAATTSVPYALVVSRWFDRHRGFALGLMMIGMGVGAILVPPIAQRLIAAYGWRNALAAFGFFVLLVPIPVVGLLLKETPEEMGMSPDGAPHIPRGVLASEGFYWREVWRSGTFWLMTTGFVLVGASVHACIIHIPQLIGDRRDSSGGAALATSVLGLALLLGRAGTGYLLDRHFAPRVAAVIFASAGVGILLIWISSQRPGFLTGAFLVGLAFGAEADIIAYLVSRYFGLRSLGITVGFAFGAFVLAGGFGPLLMDFAFDRFGSYTAPFALAFLLTLLAAGLFTRLGPYRFGVNGSL
jgi:MFS family permease